PRVYYGVPLGIGGRRLLHGVCKINNEVYPRLGLKAGERATWTPGDGSFRERLLHLVHGGLVRLVSVIRAHLKIELNRDVLAAGIGTKRRKVCDWFAIGADEQGAAAVQQTVKLHIIGNAILIDVVVNRD